METDTGPIRRPLTGTTAHWLVTDPAPPTNITVQSGINYAHAYQSDGVDVPGGSGMEGRALKWPFGRSCHLIQYRDS